MPDRCSISLVIDVGVAQAAGGERPTIDPRSIVCREFLETFVNICEAIGNNAGPCIVMTPAMFDEWHRHRSSFAQRWLRRIYARRRVISQEIAENPILRMRILRQEFNEREQGAILKDVHLVEAALATDRTIVSLDKIIRKLLASACQVAVELHSIVWVNPEIEAEDAIGWLRAGAPSEPHRCLVNWRSID